MTDSKKVDFLKDLCILENHMATQWNNKIYITGGNQWLTPKTYLSKPYKYASRHMRVLDFTSSVDISKREIVSIEAVSTEVVPPIKWGNLFAQDGKLHMFGGEQEYWSILKDDGTLPSNSTRRPTIANKLFSYNIQTKKWASTDSGLGSKNPGSTNFAYDSAGKAGWIYSGVYVDGDYYVNTTLVKGSGAKENLQAMISFNITEASFADELVPANPVGTVESGTMTFLPTVGNEGALIVFGGRTDGQAMRDMMKIHVYDISTKTWFTQDASAEGGNKPSTRYRFCSVSASAGDDSSHNIFIYGGQSESKAKTSLKDVFVLSLPSFHWIYIGDAELGKSSHICQKLQNKYLITYRGRGNLSETAEDCDQDNGGVQIFDMETLDWTTKYEVRDTTVKRATEPVYHIPERIYNIIGGDASGNATFLQPKSGWSDEKLSSLFLHTLPPAATATASKSTPLGAILGAILGGLLILALILSLILCLLKRKRNKLKKSLSAGTELQEQRAVGTGLLSPPGAGARREYYGNVKGNPNVQQEERYVPQQQGGFYSERTELPSEERERMQVEMGGERESERRRY